MRIDYRELKQQIRLMDLLTKIGWKSTRGRGEQLRGPCLLPRCHEKSPGRTADDAAFSVNTSKNIYRCFRCGSAGNALDFWQSYRAATLHQAAAELSLMSKTNNHSPS